MPRLAESRPVLIHQLNYNEIVSWRFEFKYTINNTYSTLQDNFIKRSARTMPLPETLLNLGQSNLFRRRHLVDLRHLGVKVVKMSEAIIPLHVPGLPARWLQNTVQRVSLEYLLRSLSSTPLVVYFTSLSLNTG
jgi:hypothetical protein